MSTLNALYGSLCLGGIGDLCLFAIQHGQLGGKVLLAAVGLGHQHLGGYVPILLGDKGLNVFLPHDHHTGCYGLHPSGRQSLFHLCPQQGTDLVAHQPIQHTACLLGIHQLHVQRPRILNGVLDGLFGNFVKFNTARGRRIHVQNLPQMPGDGFAFAVRVSCEQNLRSRLGFFTDSAQNVAASADGNILQFKVVIHIHADLGFGQIPDMSLGCFYFVAFAEKFGDCASLGR